MGQIGAAGLWGGVRSPLCRAPEFQKCILLACTAVDGDNPAGNPGLLSSAVSTRRKVTWVPAPSCLVPGCWADPGFEPWRVDCSAREHSTVGTQAGEV